MKIAFLGDSITEGVHGYSYIKVLEELNSNLKISNFGKGGDTVSSLSKRMKKINGLNQYDIIFLFIGINDILGKISWFYKLIKILDKQPVASSLDDLKKHYKATLDYLEKLNSKIVVIPPLLIGENINNKWNKQVTGVVKVIESTLKAYSSMDYIDIRKDFVRYLKDKELNEYIPLKAMDMRQDGIDIRSGKDIDEISVKRGLHLTIDGVHINKLGAKMIANSIQKYLSEYNK
jgi:lysophospholipase L1-like esterase